MSAKLSSHLLNLKSSAFKSATQHHFLKAAGTGTLEPKLLQTWLAQDRLYALGYLTFISSLLGKLQIPTTSTRQSTLPWRIANTLIECLLAIRREISLFEEVAAEQGWSSVLDEARPNPVTQQYRDLFAGAGQPSASLLKGMTVLWATEKCYLEAWRWARERMVEGLKDDPGKGKGDKDVMQRVFIPNWSSDEFAGFVSGLEELVDEMGQGAPEDEWMEAEDAWRQVLWLEERFWPAV